MNDAGGAIDLVYAELVAENERLRAVVERSEREWLALREVRDDAMAERDRLQTEMERVRKAAEAVLATGHLDSIGDVLVPVHRLIYLRRVLDVSENMGTPQLAERTVCVCSCHTLGGSHMVPCCGLEPTLPADTEPVTPAEWTVNTGDDGV